MNAAASAGELYPRKPGTIYYCAVAPEILTISLYFVISLLTFAANSSGEEGLVSEPMVSNCFLTASSCIAVANAWCNVLTTASGVPPVAKIPNHVLMSKSLMPDASMVGTSFMMSDVALVVRALVRTSQPITRGMDISQLSYISQVRLVKLYE